MNEFLLRFDQWNERQNGWPLAGLFLLVVVGVFWMARRT